MKWQEIEKVGLWEEDWKEISFVDLQKMETVLAEVQIFEQVISLN
jgi:hypothetical protein